MAAPSPAQMLRSLSNLSSLIGRSTKQLPVKAALSELAELCASAVREASAAVAAAGELDAATAAEVGAGVGRLAAVLQAVQRLSAAAKNRNIVGSLAAMDADAAEVLARADELEAALAATLYPITSAPPPRLPRAALSAALAADRARWDDIAASRAEGFGAGENLATVLNVPAGELRAEISAIKRAVGGMAPGAARSFLERALRDYRIMNNLSSFAASSFEIDIAFMVDCTSSMGTYLGFVHQAIRDLLGHLRAEYPHVAVRMAFVGYTDFDDRGVPTYFVRDFGTPEEVGGFLEGVACRGGYGSDFAEDVLGGLREATKLSWRNQVRVLVHVGDAPPHGRRFRDSGEANDRWYHDHIPDPNGIAPPMYRDLLSQLMSVQRVRTYLFLSLDRYTRNTEALFAEHVKGIPEAEFHVVPFAAQQGVRPDYGQFLGAVLRGAGQSIYQSVRMDTMVAPPDA